MKPWLFAAALLVTTAPAWAADVGVSISIGQPGFYGRINIGDYPQPQVIYREPILVERGPVIREPIYLRVPPGHAKNWRRYCHQYNACGERVYFVQDRWYEDEYVPRYQQRNGWHREDRDDDRRDDHRDDDHRDEHGHGHGHEHGHH